LASTSANVGLVAQPPPAPELLLVDPEDEVAPPPVPPVVEPPDPVLVEPVCPPAAVVVVVVDALPPPPEGLVWEPQAAKRVTAKREAMRRACMSEDLRDWTEDTPREAPARHANARYATGSVAVVTTVAGAGRADLLRARA
jgi:hypothetical protein